jgi:type I restriction enzyme, R subunit
VLLSEEKNFGIGLKKRKNYEKKLWDWKVFNKKLFCFVRYIFIICSIILSMENLTEKQTRELKIDKTLEQVGWKKEYIKGEVNSIKSDFKSGIYKIFDGNVEKGVDKFIDYLLLDEQKKPLAIIEAKRTSLDVEKGEIQSRTYQEDIEKQTGIKIPQFLTNGNVWHYIDEKDNKRKIKIPFTQKDLKRRADLRKREKEPSKIKINSKIVDRNRSIWAVKKVLEHFERGHRSALLNMATGTGKTRVAMAIIDGLIKSGYVQNVLFVVDRISLSNQAKENGFKEFFKEPVCELNTEGFSDSSRLYVSTVQTLMSDVKPRGKFYEKFGVGTFDLIIFDEAHRSYYDKNNDIMQYFDALKIGLTATPSNEDSRNTYKLFDCEYKKPTLKYSYEEAVNDEVLAPYSADIIETKVLTLGIEGAKLTSELKDALKKQEEDPEVAELPGSRFEKYFTDKKTNELILKEFMERCYKTPDEIPCKTIFFCASVRHAESLKNLFDKMYPTLAKTARIITSDRSRYMDEVRRFKKDSDPRIVFSVGVLDTGIDIPEICNLVFVKPVFSHIRFWQMLGRGTRNIKACLHKEWLPQKEEISIKEDFLILDFKFGDHSNVEYHQLDKTKPKSQLINAKTQIFLEQIELLGKSLEEKEKKIVSKEILDTVKDIDIDSPMVLEKKSIIKKVVSSKFDLEKHIKELKEDIAPLLIYSKSLNSKVYSFVLKCVKLFGGVKSGDIESISKVEKFVKERLEGIWEKNLEVIKKKDEEIKLVLGDSFWEDLTFEDIDFLVREIAPLMIYYEKERKNILQVHAPDYVIDVNKIKWKVKENEDFSYFINSNPLIKKIKNGEGITSGELLEIEKKLSSLNPLWTIDNIQKEVDFVLFLRDLVEIKDLPDPQEMIKWEFDKHVANKNEHYNSEQLKFLSFLKEVFVRTKHIELKNFAEHPLTKERPLDIFNPEQLKEIVIKCNELRWK